MIFWRRRWLLGLRQKGVQMFNQEHLSQIDKKYFNVIMLDGKDVTIQNRNTGHYWYLQCTEYPQDE